MLNKVNIGDRIRVVDLSCHPSMWSTTGVVSEVIKDGVFYENGQCMAYFSEIELLKKPNEQLLFDFMKDW